MKKLVLLLTVAVFAMPWLQAQDHDRIAKDIRILHRILKSTFGEDEHSHRRDREGDLRPHDITTTYLQGQGVVMLFHMGLGGHSYSRHARLNIKMPRIVIPPVPPVYVPSGTEDEDELREQYQEMMESYQEMVEEMAENAAESLEEATEALVEVEDYRVSREIESEMRRIRDEQRRMSQEIRQKAMQTRKELLKRKKMTEEERKELITELESFKAKVETDVKQYLEKAEKLRSVQSKEWMEKFTGFEAQLTDAMCEFGASVDIPDNEHINIILSRAGERGKDKIYVFRKADLAKCRNGQITKEALLKSSKVYDFE